MADWISANRASLSILIVRLPATPIAKKKKESIQPVDCRPSIPLLCPYLSPFHYLWWNEEYDEFQFIVDWMESGDDVLPMMGE